MKRIKTVSIIQSEQKPKKKNTMAILFCKGAANIIKNLVCHSHNFLLPYIIVEKYFINSITFIFNFDFICFVVNELPSFIIIVYNS